MRAPTALAITTVALLAGVAPAWGASPVVVGAAGNGGTPDIAVGTSGTAHIVWEDSAPAIEQVRYCQLPRGGSGCVNPKTFVGTQPMDDDGISGRPHVFVSSPNAVTVFQQRGLNGSGFMMANRSTDGGLTFGSRNRTGAAFPSSAAPREAVYGPGDTITSITEVTTAGVFVQNGSPLDDTAAMFHSQILSSDSGEDAAIGLHLADGSRPVAVYEIQSSPPQLAWRKLSGAVTEANINDETQWGAQEVISTDIGAADGPALAAGPSGLFLFWQRTLPDRGYVMRFTGAGWSAPVAISDGRPFTEYDLFQDSAGRLHAVWNAYADDALRYRWSDDGVNWSPTVDIARGEESYPYLRVSAAGDHQGFAVWKRGASTVVAVPLEALPPLPGGAGGGSDTIDPSATGLKVGDKTLFPGQGTRFTFNSSEAGRGLLLVEKRAKGLKVKLKGKRRCVPQTKKRLRKLKKAAGSPKGFRRALRRKRCKAWKPTGLIRKQVKAGRNTIVFSGRIAGRKLGPGRYRARLKITDLAGNVSRAETVKFRVVKPKKRK
jgi:hypothetical protein